MESAWLCLDFDIQTKMEEPQTRPYYCFLLDLVWFGRMVIEGMRTDSLMFFGLRVSQWLSVVLIGLGIFIILYQNRKKAPYYISEEEN